jgi:hypothetical protein
MGKEREYFLNAVPKKRDPITDFALTGSRIYDEPGHLC